MDIYNMKLHDSITDTDTGTDIMRVPGGWIYYQRFKELTIFVPYNDEFDEKAATARAIADMQIAQATTW